MRVEDPMLSMVAICRKALSCSGAIFLRTCQEPLN